MKIEITREYWPNGNIRREYSYLNNVLHGLQKYYFESGKIWMECDMNNNQHCGIWYEYYSNKRRKHLTQLIRNIQHSPKINFKYKNKKPLKISNYGN